MSDLLPLVAAVLGDRGAVEALEEIRQLKQELEIARAVEVIHCAPPRPDRDDNDDDDDNNNEPPMQIPRDNTNNDNTNPNSQQPADVVVYASGQFQNGNYGGNPNLWQVDLQQKTTCRLADLKSCRICVGGGIQIDSMDNNQPNRASFEGHLNGANDDVDMDDDDDNNSNNNSISMSISFCFAPNAMWLGVLVHGWPRDQWEAIVNAGDEEEDFIDADDVMDYLVETVAVNHPNATVEFRNVSFVVSTVQGALQRSPPVARQQELDATRDEQQAHFDLKGFVTETMRDRGNNNNSTLFMPQVDTVMYLLGRLGIRSIANNQEMITFVIAQYEELGESRFDDILRNSLMEMIRRLMAQNQSEPGAAAGA